MLRYIRTRDHKLLELTIDPATQNIAAQTNWYHRIINYLLLLQSLTYGLSRADSIYPNLRSTSKTSFFSTATTALRSFRVLLKLSSRELVCLQNDVDSPQTQAVTMGRSVMLLEGLYSVTRLFSWSLHWIEEICRDHWSQIRDSQT